MRRRWQDGADLPRLSPGGRVEALRRLRRALSDEEYRSLRRLTGGMRRLPFGADTDAMEHVLLEAGDDDVDLLVKCQTALASGPGQPERPAPERAPDAARERRQPRIALSFAPDSPDLRPFLASLRRNGFRAVAIERSEGVTVFVEVRGASDLEVVRAMALVSSLRDLVARAEGHTLRGRQAGR